MEKMPLFFNGRNSSVFLVLLYLFYNISRREYDLPIISYGFLIRSDNNHPQSLNHLSSSILITTKNFFSIDINGLAEIRRNILVPYENRNDDGDDKKRCQQLTQNVHMCHDIYKILIPDHFHITHLFQNTPWKRYYYHRILQMLN